LYFTGELFIGSNIAFIEVDFTDYSNTPISVRERTERAGYNSGSRFEVALIASNVFRCFRRVSLRSLRSAMPAGFKDL